MMNGQFVTHEIEFLVEERSEEESEDAIESVNTNLMVGGVSDRSEGEIFGVLHLSESVFDMELGTVSDDNTLA